MSMENQRILVDPVSEERASPFPWVGPKRFHPSPVSAEELPDIDIVLITHDHYDHLEKSTIVTINKNIGERLGPFDVTFLKIGAYSDKGTWRLLHMTPEEAGQQHLDLRGQLLIPMHWATFDMALHPWYEPIERLVTFSEQESITLITPEVGKIINLRDNSNIDHWWLKYKKNNSRVFLPVKLLRIFLFYPSHKALYAVVFMCEPIAFNQILID